MHTRSPNDLAVHSRVAMLEPGMYIFRFASQLSASTKACIGLQHAPLGGGSIDFFPGEGVSKNTLTKLGDCVVGRVKGGSTGILITEYRLASGISEPIDLRIDRIDTSAAIVRKPAPDAGSSESQTQPVQLSLLGHIEFRGDVTVLGEWLGNPASTHRIEGFAVTWPNKPDGVDIAYTCSIAGAEPAPPVKSGDFVGTRRKAAPITAIALGLVGPNSKQYQLRGEVAFAGCKPLPVRAGEKLAGPRGTEHLVALRLSIDPNPETNAPRYQSPWEDPAVTQIYIAEDNKGHTA